MSKVKETQLLVCLFLSPGNFWISAAKWILGAEEDLDMMADKVPIWLVRSQTLEAFHWWHGLQTLSSFYQLIWFIYIKKHHVFEPKQTKIRLPLNL